MKLVYYPGCSSQGTSLEYERSTRAVCRVLGVELVDIEDWSCCGSTPAHACDAVLSAALSARNLSLAAARGAEKVATPCPSCLANLKTARHHMEQADFHAKVNGLLDAPCPAPEAGLPDTFSTLQVLVEEIGLDAVKAKVRRPLEGLRIAPYYGCIMSRPEAIMRFDDPENPQAMDELLRALGAEVVPFPLKTECCGAAMGIPRRDLTARLSGRLLASARDFGADAVAVACPLCHMNLDLRQDQAGNACQTRFNMPVLYFTQLMGVAFGLTAEELGLEKLCVSPAPLLQKLAHAASARAAADKATAEKAPVNKAPAANATAEKTAPEGAAQGEETA